MPKTKQGPTELATVTCDDATAIQAVLQEKWLELLPEHADELRGGKVAIMAYLNSLQPAERRVEQHVFVAPGGRAPVVYDADVADDAIVFVKD